MTDGDVIGANDLALPPDRSRPGSSAADPERREEAVGASERRRILEALDATRWNRKAAAEIVGLTYRQFRYRLSQLGIDAPRTR